MYNYENQSVKKLTVNQNHYFERIFITFQEVLKELDEHFPVV